jgi:hypothetical protein
VTHRTAQQKARDRRANPLGGRPAQIAPAHPVAPVACVTCGDVRIIHRDGGPCLRAGCDCETYVEET